MKRKYIGRTVKEVGKNAIDFQTINHITFGFASYLIIYLLFNMLLDNTMMCLISLIIAIMWEVYENVISPEAWFRVWGMDSVENSLMDIVFGGVGIIIGYLTCFLEGEDLLLMSFVILITLVFSMVICMKITHANSGKDD